MDDKVGLLTKVLVFTTVFSGLIVVVSIRSKVWGSPERRHWLIDWLIDIDRDEMAKYITEMRNKVVKVKKKKNLVKKSEIRNWSDQVECSFKKR